MCNGWRFISVIHSEGANNEVINMDEQQIIGLLFQRSEQAITQIQQVYGRACLAVARRILPDARDAEECVSDACLKVWDTIPPEHPRSLGAYLMRITRNLALDRHDYNSAACRATALASAYEELEPFLSSVMRDDADDATFRHTLNRFLRSLPERTRNCFIRRYWYGESIREIAESYYLKEETVKSMLFRTKNSLKRALEKEEVFV